MPSRETTIGRLLLEDALPADLHHHVPRLDKQGLGELAVDLAERYPDRYRDIMRKLSHIANQAGYESGGYSFGPEDLEITPRAHALREGLKQRVRQTLADSSLAPHVRNERIVHAALESMEPLQQTVAQEARDQRNPLAMQVVSGAKGSDANLRSLLAGDTLYLDANDKPVPIAITHSFHEGLRPAEYLAAAAGARKAIVTTKLGTAAGGWLAKRIGNLSHRLVVVDRDGRDPHGGVRGLPVDTHDPANEGASLAQAVGNYPRNTILTRAVLGDLKRQGLAKILVRSPLVGGPPDGGVYGLDVGVRERGGISPRGDAVGRAAADAISEPLTQSIIGSKHGSGVAGSSRVQSGFPVFERLFSIPATFPGGATHAQGDGRINDIRDAPQGGKEIIVDGETHHADVDQDPIVKVGDRVEAGDPLTDGIERPDELVKHKGIGEARRRFVEIFGKYARASGLKADRRNVELVARGLIDHVEMHQEYGDHVPGDLVSYTALEHGYEPRPGHTVAAPRDAVGHYLERPALHYSIGTRITPRVAEELQTHGVGTVTSHPQSPPFEPVMVRSNDIPALDSDWITRGLGSNVEKSLLDSAARGGTADPTGTSYAPALAEGVHFGAPGTKTRGWSRSEIAPVKL